MKTVTVEEWRHINAAPPLWTRFVLRNAYLRLNIIDSWLAGIQRTTSRASNMSCSTKPPGAISALSRSRTSISRAIRGAACLSSLSSMSLASCESS